MINRAQFRENHFREGGGYGGEGKKDARAQRANYRGFRRGEANNRLMICKYGGANQAAVPTGRDEWLSRECEYSALSSIAQARLRDECSAAYIWYRCVYRGEYITFAVFEFYGEMDLGLGIGWVGKFM